MAQSSNFLGKSAAARGLAQIIGKAAPTAANVLIVGESGTGKEVIARAIHAQSARRDAPFVAANCGAITPSLAESELFGHEKGSFTGAVATTTGWFEHAHGGTLFLDEVTEMPLSLQVQLLRVLENGQYHRVGGTEQQCVDLRVIAATNRDPRDAVRAGVFRADLFYRLAVFPIMVPPLRERKADIAFLSQRFLDQLNAQEKTRKKFSADAMARLESHHWPGNIRELKNTITRAYILADDELDIAPSGPAFRAATSAQCSNGVLKIRVGTPIRMAEQAVIAATLDHYAGDRRRTALALGISSKTLYNRLEQFPKAPNAG
jgi:DNA-binding NtrC family response regulator